VGAPGYGKFGDARLRRAFILRDRRAGWHRIDALYRARKTATRSAGKIEKGVGERKSEREREREGMEGERDIIYD